VSPDSYRVTCTVTAIFSETHQKVQLKYYSTVGVSETTMISKEQMFVAKKCFKKPPIDYIKKVQIIHTGNHKS